jgi:hypothetical protein
MNKLIILNKNDNVAVTPFVISSQTKFENQDIVSVDPIPFGHKICLKPINKGCPVIESFQFLKKIISPLKKAIYSLMAFLETMVMLQPGIILVSLVQLTAQQR